MLCELTPRFPKPHQWDWGGFALCVRFVHGQILVNHTLSDGA